MVRQMVHTCVAAWVGLWAGWVGFGYMASVSNQLNTLPPSIQQTTY